MKILLLVILCAIPSLSVSVENYCHDAETNEYWEDLKIRAANNKDIINLANYRKELCSQVDKDELSVQEATDLFEFERSRVVDKLRKEEKLRNLPNKKNV